MSGQETLISFAHNGEGVSEKTLSSGWVHLRGSGPCNFAQPRRFPCSDDDLEASFFPEASESFRRAVRTENAIRRGDDV